MSNVSCLLPFFPGGDPLCGDRVKRGGVPGGGAAYRGCCCCGGGYAACGGGGAEYACACACTCEPGADAAGLKGCGRGDATGTAAACDGTKGTGPLGTYLCGCGGRCCCCAAGAKPPPGAG